MVTWKIVLEFSDTLVNILKFLDTLKNIFEFLDKNITARKKDGTNQSLLTQSKNIWLLAWFVKLCIIISICRVLNAFALGMALRLSIHIFKENDYRTITLDTSYDAFPARAVATQPRPANKGQSLKVFSLLSLLKIF